MTNSIYRAEVGDRVRRWVGEWQYGTVEDITEAFGEPVVDWDGIGLEQVGRTEIEQAPADEPPGVAPVSSPAAPRLVGRYLAGLPDDL